MWNDHCVTVILCITGLGLSASDDAVVALRRTRQRPVADLDVVLSAQCHFTQEHDPDAFVLPPRRTHCTHTHR